MSLGKLLTTGKSLVGLSNANSRYQLRKGALPKFDSAKNPFTSKTAAEPSEREPQLPKLSPAELKAATMKNTQPLPLPGQKTESPAAEPPAIEPAQPAAPVDGWLKKLNPLVWFGSRKPAEPKPAIPRFDKPHAPVQGELSLDNVKVMRNDLSEADVEVVPAKARPPKAMPASLPGAAAGAAAMAIPDLPPARKAWEYLGEHLMGKH